jgi:AraC-like DNA-binding protein
MKKRTIQQDFFKLTGGNVQHFKALLDLIPDVAFFMKDREGRFVMNNQRACEFCRVKQESETFGKTDHDFFTKEQADEYVRGDQEVIRTGKPIVNAMCAAPGATKQLIVYSKVPVYNNRKKIIGVAGIHRIIDGMRDLPQWQGRFAQCVDYIHKHYMKPIRTEQLAKMAGVSKRQLDRRFIRLFNANPNEYLQQVRVQAARELLETTTRTITDIAQSCGFYDHSHFTKTFKLIMSCTPFSYRKKHLSKD